jgi:transcription initiation factor TFIIIB Brf1 subunit/transcription initiation factor TFIIB
MNDKTDKKEDRKDRCEDCGSYELTTSHVRAEKVCDDCGLVAEFQVYTANDDNRNHGEEATAGRVNTFGKTDIGTALGSKPLSKQEIRGLSPSARKAFFRLRLMERGTVRDSHPFYGKVMNQMKSLYGSYSAIRLEHLARMACTPLNLKESKIRDGLKSCDQKRLAMPKQSICRQKDDLKGDSEENNARIIAIALAELGGDLQITSKIDRRYDLPRFGLTDKQILTAKTIIMKHYKARVSFLGVAPPRRIDPSELRCDDVDQVISHLEENLSITLSDADLDAVHRNAGYRLDLLREPGDGVQTPLTVNTNIRMVVACVYYATLQSLDLADGLLNRVASTCRLTGSGVSSRLEQFRDEDISGKLFVDGAFEDFVKL